MCWLDRKAQDVITYSSSVVVGACHTTIWSNRHKGIYKMLEITSRVQKARVVKETGVTPPEQLFIEEMLGL